MKKGILLLIALVFTTHSWSQNIELMEFDSKELHEERSLKIYIPPSYKIDSTKFYPLTIVLDAEYLFDAYVGNSIMFAAKEEAPEQIIIGINQIAYNRRYQDCGYSKVNSYPTEESEAFYRFIRSELLTHFEGKYRVSPFKTIVGNTLTANFTNYFLIEDYPGFNAFVNINPSYAIGMPNMVYDKVNTLKNENIYYYLSNCIYNSEKRQTPINEGNALLSTIENESFKYKFDSFDNTTRTGSVGQSISSALSFIYRMYSPISKQEFENEIKDLSPPDAIAYLENKYVEIEYLFGSNLKIREKDIFAIESIIMDKDDGDYLKNFGEMINNLYKESPIGDYYIGLYYETGNKYKKAINYYKSGYMKLAEDDPNSDAYYENVQRVLNKQDGSYTEPENN